MLTQPMAEMMHLLASHPNPRAVRRAYWQRKAMMELDPEAYAMLQYASSTTLGTNTLTTRLLDNHAATGQFTEHFRESYEGQVIKDILKLETLGRLDRAKGTFIRELGTLMELESNMTGLARTAKAIKGQNDAIENIAHVLERKSPAEQLKYMFSDRGIKDSEALTNEIRDALAAGDLLIKNVDDQMGNWTAVTPGLEAGVASIAFFYPYTRFSLKWVLHTFPKNHPAWYAAWTMMGGMHAQLVEEIMGGDPPFLSGWAQVPLYNKDGQVVSMMPVARLMGTSNAAWETVGSVENPLDLLGPTVPGVKIFVDYLADFDQYGNKLEGRDSEKGPDWLDRAWNAIDQTLSLSPLYREPKRQGLIPGIDARQLQPGDDPNGHRAFMRRMLGPMADYAYAIWSGQAPGVPTDVVQSGVRYEKLYDAFLEAGIKTGAEIPAALKKARDKEEQWYMELNSESGENALWVPKIRDLEERYNDYHVEVMTAKVQWAREQARYRNWKSRDKDWAAYQRLKASKDNAQTARETLAYVLDQEAKMSGLKGAPLDQELVRKGKEAAKNVITEQPNMIQNSRGQWVIEGSPQSGDYDPDKGYWQATVPQGAKTIKHLGVPVENLGWEQPDGTVRKPDGTIVGRGDVSERKLLDPWEGQPPGFREDATKDFVDRNRLTEQVKKSRRILAEAPLKERPEDRALRLRLNRRGEALHRRGVLNNNPKIQTEGLAMIDKAKKMESEVSAARTRRAEARADLIQARAALKEKGETFIYDGTTGQYTTGDRAPGSSSNVPPDLANVVPGSMRANVKRRWKWANHVLDLKEQMNSGGAGIKPKAPVPKDLIPIYKKAAAKYGLGPKGPAMLAAINEIETAFGTNTNVSSAGAQGWMQFMPGTWDGYGVDADGDGTADPYSKVDAIHSAANYLSANDAPNDWGNALYRYNNAQWYVDQVSARAEEFQGSAGPKQQKILEAKFWEAVRTNKALGNYDVPEKSMMVEVKPGDVPGKGDWMGTQIILERAAKPWEGIISSRKRSTQNTASGGISDHWSGATANYAVDIGADSSTGDAIAKGMHKRLGLVEPYETSWKTYTSKKYPGFTFQIGWQTDPDHYNHVHVGAQNTDATQVSVGPMSMMARARAARNPANEATSAAIAGGAISSGGAGATSAAGGAAGTGTTGTPTLDTLEGFREAYGLGSNGFIGGGGEIKVDELPFLAEIAAQTKGLGATGPVRKKLKTPTARASQLGLYDVGP
jgi:hypothetical protein